jgi:hypothetical protein
MRESFTLSTNEPLVSSSQDGIPIFTRENVERDKLLDTEKLRRHENQSNHISISNRAQQRLEMIDARQRFN